MKSIHSIRFWINHIRLLNLMSHVTFSGSKRSISKSKQQTVLIHTHSVLCYLYTEILPGNTLIHMFRIIKILVSGAAREFSVFKSLTKRCAINSAHKWLLRSNSHLKQSRDSCTTCSMILHHCYCNSSQFLFHSVVFRCLRPYRVVSYMLAVGSEGLSCLFLPLLNGFFLLIPFSLIYGYFDGAYVALIPVVTSDTVSSTHLTSALGVVYFLHAIPYLISPPIGGQQIFHSLFNWMLCKLN